MAGFRTFATGEVLTAANVNDFLMKQSVMVFDDATARTTALGAEVTEGMLTFNKDTGALEVFDGTDFVPAGAEPNLVAVKSAIFTATQTESVAAGANVAVDDLTITHALADASNRLIISAFLGAAASSNQTANVGLSINDGTNLLVIGDASGARTRITMGGRPSGLTTHTRTVTMPTIMFVHAPGDTTERTYTVRAINLDNSTQTLFINRSQTSDNEAASGVTVSGFVIQEVKV